MICAPRRRVLEGLLLLLVAGAALAQDAPKKDNIAGPYVPSPWPIVDEIIKLADIRSEDVVFDLGSGDGRLVTAAAKRHGARGVGIEIQTHLVELATIQARHEGVADRVKFVAADLFETDLRGASVVTLYLLPRFVTRLVPKLRAELAPGSRIVSHDYPLAPWPPDKTLIFDVPEKEAISGSVRTTLYYYLVPAQVGGRWAFAVPREVADRALDLRLMQGPDVLEGRVETAGRTYTLRDLSVKAKDIRFGLFYDGRLMQFSGTVEGGSMSGEVRAGALRERWTAKLMDREGH